jgi:heat shock protein HslJ
MKSLRYIVLLSLVTLLLASCAALPPVFPSREVAEVEQPEPTLSAPTEPAVIQTDAPTVAPSEPVTSTVVVTVTVEATLPPATVEPVATPGADQVMGANPLVGTVWEWAALLRTSPAMQSVVPDPASYTIIFAEDGNALIKADCNNARATYTLNDDALTIQLGAITRAACPPGSLAANMLTSLSQAASYVMDNGDLILRLGDADDSMLFRNGGPSAMPAEPPTAATAPAATTEAPAGAAAPGAATLVGPVWQWQEFIDVATGNASLPVKNPEQYTLTFMDDGTVAMKADCNQAAGTFTVDGAKLTVVVGPVTLAACGGESMGEAFLINLTSAATFALEDGKLFVDLMADGGRMVFAPAR